MLGDQTKKVSSHDQLLKERVTNGAGVPAHTPEVDSQRYNNISDESYHIWVNGVWTGPFNDQP